VPTARGTCVTRTVEAFDPIPSRHPSLAVEVHVVPTVPDGAGVVGLPVHEDGANPDACSSRSSPAAYRSATSTSAAR